MSHTMWATTFLLVAALAASCSSTDEDSAAGSKGSVSAATQRDKARAETIEAVQATQDYAYAQKAEFIAQMKEELVEIQEELDRLSTKLDRSSGAAKADAETQLEAAREKWVDATKQLDEAERATETTWDDVRGACKKSYGELQDALDRTRQWLSDMIEP
jgi:TolA-binding protein